jgi:hypothetical protein
MKNALKYILGAALLAGDTWNHLNDAFYEEDLRKESAEDKARRLKKAERAKEKVLNKKRERQNIRRFVYGDTSIWARSKENADRKAKAKGLI